MIFYFSATGNDKYVAERIAEQTGERLVSIAQCSKRGRFDFALQNGEPLGFVTPTYFWGIPAIVADFLRRAVLRGTGERYVFHVLTCGSVTGNAGGMLAKLLQRQGFRVEASFAVRMVDTWTPIFNLSDPHKNQRVTESAESHIAEIVGKIAARKTGDFNHNKGFWPGTPFAQAAYRSFQKTKRFRVSKACIGCGLCAQQCPCGAIALQNGKPVWVKEKCTACLGCLHRCPEFAILYGRHTQKHGQFVNPNTQLP